MHGTRISPDGPELYSRHESSYVDESCKIGRGTKIWHFCHIMQGSEIGEDCNIGQNVVVSPQVVLGRNVKVQNNVSIYTGCILEDDVFCGPSVVFTNVINPRSLVSRRNEYKRTLVRQGATLGANSTIVCGITIGRYAFVGAGSVVTRDVPEFALVYGNPARVRGWICVCGVKLSFETNSDTSEASCRNCSRNYLRTGTKVIADVMVGASS